MLDLRPLDPSPNPPIIDTSMEIDPSPANHSFKEILTDKITNHTKLIHLLHYKRADLKKNQSFSPIRTKNASTDHGDSPLLSNC